MFELTNEQRKCFALVPVSDQWERIEVKPSPYDQFKTYIYLDGVMIVKCILCGDAQYCEYELAETVSPDKKYLMPKTAKGKPVLLSSSNILKRKSTGMVLSYKGNCIRLWGDRGDYYSNSYLQDEFRDLSSFSRWVEDWCAETSDAEREDVSRFSQQKRLHVRYREGDVFRFKIGRRLYGYGRILLDYDKMRKKKEPFWDILMSKPLVCSVYHIVTHRDNVSLDELQHLGSLPSTIIADNSLFYGEYEIIGNLPVTENEDYPVMYGNSIHMGEKAVCYQCGKTFRKIDNGTAMCGGFVNNGVSFNLNFTLDILQQCVVEGSNNPYWSHYYPHWVDRDLRNPKHAEKLQAVKEQFGL